MRVAIAASYATPSVKKSSCDAMGQRASQTEADLRMLARARERETWRDRVCTRLRPHVAAHDEAHGGAVEVAIELVAQVRFHRALLVVEGRVPPDREHRFVRDSRSGRQRSSLAILKCRPSHVHALLLRIQGALERRWIEVCCRPAELNHNEQARVSWRSEGYGPAAQPHLL